MKFKSALVLAALGISIAGCATSEELTPTRSVMTEASSWTGSHAKSNRKELKNYMTAANTSTVDPVKTPWCAGFANAVLVNNGYQGTNSLLARSFLRWGWPVKHPKEGDIVVLRRGKNPSAGHVGFFAGYEYFEGMKYVKVLGGNTDKKVDVGYFPIRQVLAYRTPEPPYQLAQR